MRSDLGSELAELQREYVAFELAARSETAARAFNVRVARLGMIGAPARDALEQMLVNPDAAARNAAARALAGLHDPDAAARLIAAFLRHDRPLLNARYLARLGKATPVPAAMLPRFEQVRPFERCALATALFRYPSPVAEAAIEPIFGGFESNVAEAAIEGMAGWGDPRWLRDVLALPPMRGPASLPASLQPDDVRVVAAFHLALGGDAEALDLLRGWASSRQPLQAARAVEHLASLAHPDGVAPTLRLLRGRGGRPLELALDAAEVYRTGAMASELLALAAKPARREAALTAAAWIADPDPEAAPTFERLQPRTSTLDPARRFACGAPLTLAILAEELVSRHAGPRTGAAYNLRAITGEDHGFDLGDDLAGNLAAVQAWRERARVEAPMGRGAWAFRGVALPAPMQA